MSRPKRGAKRKAIGISPPLSAAPAQRLTALVKPSRVLLISRQVFWMMPAALYALTEVNALSSKTMFSF